MSASREKRTRQDDLSVGSSVTGSSAAKKDNSHVMYTVLGVIIAAVVIALLVWNSNFFQNRAAAVTINGEKYTASDVQFQYAGLRQYESYYAMMGQSTFNPQMPAKDQMYDKEKGITWHDHFVENAVESLTNEVALATEAEKAGHVLSDEAKADMEETLAGLESTWISSGYASRDAYLRAAYGAGMSYDKFKEVLNRAALASDYATAHAESLTYEKADLEDFYDDHQNELDSFVLTQFLFQATIPTETDAEGNPVEKTEEEKAALLETAKAEAKANAQEMMDRLKAGEDPNALAEEFGDKVTYSYISEKRTGDQVNSEYSEWLFDAARKDGDVTMVEYEGGPDTYNFAVAMFEDRFLDDAPTANIRHILIGAGTEPTDEEYAEAEKKAQDMLEKWKDDGASEDNFAQLATENSADTSSASKGGLMNVSADDGFVETFTAWALDPARKAGDTGIVKNTGSSTKGYHLMYFVGWDDPRWMQNVELTMRQDDITEWQEGIYETYTAETGAGLKYVM